VLDLGAGVGVHAIRCAAAGAEVVAADWSEKNLAKAWSLLAGAQLSHGQDARATVRLVRCDASKPLPFRAESFTGALLFDIIEHLPDDAAALRECARILRPGAWLAIALPNSQTRWKERYRRAGLFWMNDRDHKREYTWPEAVALIESAGLRLRLGPETIALDTPLTGWMDLAGGLSLRLYRRLLEWRARALARHPQDTTGFRCTAIKP
jgi:SAM-dependent methyltransferase